MRYHPKKGDVKDTDINKSQDDDNNNGAKRKSKQREKENLIKSKNQRRASKRYPGDLIRRPDRFGSYKNPIGFYVNFRQTDEFL